MESEQTRVFVSSAGAPEIATEIRLGKLTWSTPGSVESYCRNQGFELLSIGFGHAERAGFWPQEHGNPFDRMLAAQSDKERMPVATNDPVRPVVAGHERPVSGDPRRGNIRSMKEGTREWIRSRAELLAVASMVVGVVVVALVAALLFPNAGKTVVTAGVAVLVLAVAAFYAWARFPMAPRESSPIGIPTLPIGGQLKRTRALFQRIMLLALVAWCVGVTLMSPNLTSAKRNALAIVGSLVLSVAGWLLVRNHLRCPRCGSDFKKERSAKLGRWSMDSRGAAELWDACPHCGVSFNEPYR